MSLYARTEVGVREKEGMVWHGSRLGAEEDKGVALDVSTATR
jgi:hypothetical protein